MRAAFLCLFSWIINHPSRNVIRHQIPCAHAAHVCFRLHCACHYLNDDGFSYCNTIRAGIFAHKNQTKASTNFDLIPNDEWPENANGVRASDTQIHINASSSRTHTHTHKPQIGDEKMGKFLNGWQAASTTRRNFNISELIYAQRSYILDIVIDNWMGIYAKFRKYAGYRHAVAAHVLLSAPRSGQINM